VVDLVVGCCSSPRVAFARLDLAAGPGQHLHGLSDGTWSLVEGLRVLLERIGPARLVISTWTAARADLEQALRFLEDGRLVDLRLVIDGSFQSRKPEVCERARELFGPGAVRVWRSHCKFCILEAEEPPAGTDWAPALLYLTSANLNPNPRLENWSLLSAVDVVAAYRDMIDGLFADQPEGALWAPRAHKVGETSYKAVAGTGARVTGPPIEAEEEPEPEDLAVLFDWPEIETAAPPYLVAQYRDVAGLVNRSARKMEYLLRTSGWVREDFDQFSAAQKQWAAGARLKVELADRLARLAKPAAAGIAG